MAPSIRIALVTGANKGIGFAIVRHLALQYPASSFSNNSTLPLLIYLTARDQGRGESAVKSLQDDPDLKKAKVLAKDGGLSTIKYHGLDISKDDSIRSVADFLKEEHPDGIDMVVNNAGIAGHGFDAEVVKTTLQSNYHGTVLATQTFLPLLRTGGRLVNVASMAGNLTGKYSPAIREQFLATRTVADVTKMMDAFHRAVENGTHTKEGWPNNQAYSVSKSGLIGATRAIAAEKKTKHADRGVLINSCCPGYVVTDMTRGGGVKTVDEGAQTPVLLALGDIGGTTGEFWQNEKILPW